MFLVDIYLGLYSKVSDCHGELKVFDVPLLQGFHTTVHTINIVSMRDIVQPKSRLLLPAYCHPYSTSAIKVMGDISQA